MLLHSGRDGVHCTNVDAVDTLAEILCVHGHKVTVAYTPETALQAFASQRVKLAVPDIGLPGLDGYERAELMRNSGSNAGVPYVALSGFWQATDRERSALTGFTVHLVKLLAPDALALLPDT